MKQVMAALTSFEAALDDCDTDTYAHCQRTACIAVVIGRRLGLSHDQLLTLERGVFFHDIGKIHVPARILNKAGVLEEAEWKVMRGHAVTGYAMLSSNPALAEAAAIVLAHHERYDGMGYPHRLEGEDIPLGARICAVADCFDMLTAADRSYRRATSITEAWSYVRSQQGHISIRWSSMRFCPSHRHNGGASMHPILGLRCVAPTGACYTDFPPTISRTVLLTTFHRRW